MSGTGRMRMRRGNSWRHYPRGGGREVAQATSGFFLSTGSRKKETRKGFFRKPPKVSKFLANKSFSMENREKNIVFRAFL